MKFLFTFVLLAVLASSVLGQSCRANTCLNCTSSGCNWCSKITGNSFCTALTSANAANCTASTADNADVFITTGNTPQCFGGCGTFDICDGCQVPGCTWCFKGATTGCLPSGSSCEISALSGTCTPPCGARTDCQSCLAGDITCTWLSTGSSAFKGSCSTTTPGTSGTVINALASCPAKPAQNSANSVSVAGVIVTLALIAVALF